MERGGSAGWILGIRNGPRPKAVSRALFSRLCADLCRHFRWRQAEPEHRSVPQLAFHSRLAAVVEHDVFHDRQTQARAAGLARTRFVDAVKALEQAWQMF